MLATIIVIVLAYFVGSIPFGLLLTRAAGLGDIRNIGSGNIGATNVLRTGNRGLALATLLLDGGKGAVVVLLVRYLLMSNPGLFADGPVVQLPFIAAIAVFIGHCFPVWLKFRGGKGVATYIGILLALAWPVGLIFCGTWLLIAYTRKISSLSALTASATAPIFAYVYGGIWFGATAAVLAIVVYFNHRANIIRLIKGTEPKIGDDKPKAG